MPTPDLPPLEHLSLPGEGVTLHAVAAGDPSAPVVLLLHGFPEFWYGWRYQIGPLAAAGFRVVAVDQRGYNISGKPTHVRDYAIGRLAADVAAVLNGLKAPKAAVVGHDWGGAVAWWLALTRPDRVSRLAVINCPHPAAMSQAVRGGDLGQLLRSWYIFAFQVPRLPEWTLGRSRNRRLAESLRATSRPGTFTDADLEPYRAAWAEPGALTGMLNWYRAAVRSGGPRPPDPAVRVPTLLVWGCRDQFLKTDLARTSIGHCPDGRLELFPRATHWVQHEEPERVNALLVEFLRAPAT